MASGIAKEKGSEKALRQLTAGMAFSVEIGQTEGKGLTEGEIMPSPFPGMDPYLESPVMWPDVHHELISQIRAALNLTIRPRYVARVELRVYISDDDDPGREALVPDLRVEATPRRKGGKKVKHSPPVAIAEPLIIPLLLDDEIEEARIEIRHLETDSLVTVIEVMSPTNKIRGARGRTSFMDKRREVLASEVNWVEIDLLRDGAPSVTHPPLIPCDYRVMVSRVRDRHRGRYWPISVRQPLPVIGIPLRGKDADVPLDLGAVLNAAYDNAAYEASIDYRKEPNPPLNTADAAWAKQVLRERGLR